MEITNNVFEKISQEFENIEISKSFTPSSFLISESFMMAQINHGLDYYLCVIFINLISFLYLFLKFYRLACYAKLTFEWLPMVNPYNYPLAYLYILTNPYFLLWKRILPNLRFEKSSLEISAIVGLECMNAVLYLCVRVVNVIITYLETLEQVRVVLPG
jgi:uncharacterized protein YggT (Ycf19 family)